MSWEQRLHTALQQRRDQDLWRQRTQLSSVQGTEVTCNGEHRLNFCSNDYLGLAAQGGDDLAAAAERWQLGSGSSHLVCGHSNAHHALEDALAKLTGYPRAILFSTGYMANLADIPTMAELCQKHGALLMADDAHGFGVLGTEGAGVRAHFNLTPEQLPVYVGTLGKALGGYGAFVAGSEEMIDYMVQFARSYIYTTALPPALAEGMLGNLERLQNDQLRETLQQRIQQFRTKALALGLPLMDSNSPIQPLMIGSAAKAMAMSAALHKKGIWVSAIRPPTVPQNEARLRITLSAAHSEEQIDRLIHTLAEISGDILKGRDILEVMPHEQ
jgi:7-keto-8-aminopelargonate synthetase-like enzyme